MEIPALNIYSKFDPDREHPHWVFRPIYDNQRKRYVFRRMAEVQFAQGHTLQNYAEGQPRLLAMHRAGLVC